MDLFKTVPENFFSLLNCKNQEVYAGCIMEAFKVYEDSSILGIDKNLVVEVLTDYLEKEHFEPEESLEEFEGENNDNSLPRKKALFVVRRMEECGWIDIDVTNDYQELLNFRDYAITFTEALLRVEPSYYEYGDSSSSEYRGYIYTIYSLLTNSDNIEYGVLMEQVYRNTKLFIRELRKLDSRLKDYIRSIVDQTEIKGLMDSLINYKVELVDKAYYRLKTSDNVNKYRLQIVNKLEDFAADPIIMKQIALSYRSKYNDDDDAMRRASRDLGEIIEVFSQLDDMIMIIDEKNKNYINSTIGKIEFLLKEDNNVPGKINVILKYISKMNKKGRADSAVNMVQQAFRLKSFKTIGGNSYYTPRGAYQKPEPQKLLEDKIDIMDAARQFIHEYDTEYTEEKILAFIARNLTDGKLQASSLIHDDSTIDDILLVVYSLIYANNNDESIYNVVKLDHIAETKKFKFNDFLIVKEDK